MLLKTIGRFTAIAALAAGAPQAALAQNNVVAFGNGPIAITSFHIDESYQAGVAGGELDPASQPGIESVRLKFTNTGVVPATVVKFVVSDDRATRVIVDKGTFSPGVQIDHNFVTGDGQDVRPNVTCTVAEVDFADGSSWRAVSQL
jgi:hypothetical protein